MRVCIVLIPFYLIGLSSASAEQYSGQATPISASVDRQVSRTVITSNGQVGQRQTRAEITPNAAPLDRIQNRIVSRVQNRLRNRLDRYYDPQVNATTSSFDAASRETNAAGGAQGR